jgi:hypothetical protein
MKFVNPEVGIQLLLISGALGDDGEVEGIPLEFLFEMYADQIAQVTDGASVINMFENMLEQAEQAYEALSVLSKEGLHSARRKRAKEDRVLPIHLKTSAPALYDFLSIDLTLEQYIDLYNAWEHQSGKITGGSPRRRQLMARVRSSPLMSSLRADLARQLLSVEGLLDVLETTPYIRWDDDFKAAWGDDFKKTWARITEPIQLLEKYR